MKHDFERLTNEALTEPGKLSAAYSAFWNYSMGNQWLAMWQLGRVEPIGTFPPWKAVGRHVRKGEKAIELLMPAFKKTKDEATGEEDSRAFFLAKRHWFGLHQTDGQPYTPPPIPGFEFERALNMLGITEEPFAAMSGNTMGYAKPDQKIIAVSPLAYDPIRTKFHECAHVLLHPGMTSQHAENSLPRDVKEAGAELTAYLSKSALGLTDGLEYSRGYLRTWMDDKTAEKIRFGKVFAAVGQILRAGREPQPERPTAPAASVSALQLEHA